MLQHCKHVHRGVMLAALLCSPWAQVLAADSLDTVVVTATRNAQSLRTLAAPVIVITREDIENSLATDLADLLRFHAGLEIARNGGPGANTSLFMRGTESNHTVVMIDGIKINPGTLGGAAIQNIDPELIERIEIVKGPRSTLYGSEAIGGVINIITRRDENINLALRVGADQGRKVAGGFNARHVTGRAGLNFSASASDGFPARASSESDNAYRNTSLNAYLDHYFDADTYLELRHWQSQGTGEYLNFLLNPRDQDFRNSASELSLRNAFAANWRSQLKLGYIEDKLDQNQGTDFAHTARWVLDWQNDVELAGNQLLSAGLMISDESTDTAGFAGFEEDTRVNAVFVQDIVELGAHTLLAGLRHTDHESFGDHDTWNLEYSYNFGAGSQLFATAGTAFRAPDATDRFGFGGNPNLRPERSRNVEAGLRYRLDSANRVKLSAFDNRIDDLIGFDLASFSAANIDKARIRGIEAGYEFQKDGWSFALDALYQNPEDTRQDQQLVRRAKRSVSARLEYACRDFAAGLHALYSGERPDFDAFTFARKDLDAYTLVNLNARLTLDRAWAVHLKVENLFDEEYQLVDDYNTARRGAYVELRYNGQ